MKPLRVAIQMDAPETLKPSTDSTIALGLEAQQRGHSLFYYQPQHLAATAHTLSARGHDITFHDQSTDFYTLGEPHSENLHAVDVVLMRQDPPFNMGYLTAAYLLERLPPHVQVMNNPRAVRDLPEKLSPLRLPEHLAPTLITADVEAVRAFVAEHQDVVVKPLYWFGGKGVLRLRAGDSNLESLMEMLGILIGEPLVIQRFIPEVHTAEKRIFVIDGKVMGGFQRIPAAGEIRSNTRAGGSYAPTELTRREQEVCEHTARLLAEHDIIFAGIDIIGGHLNEINITCPTGLKLYTKLYGKKLEPLIWDAIERRLNASTASIVA